MIPFIPTLARYRRWIAIGLGAMAAGMVMPFMKTVGQIQLPGMAEPYVVGPVDPYVATALAYLIVSFIARRAFDRLVAGARSALRR